MFVKKVSCFLFFFFFLAGIVAQPVAGPKVLVVTSHPDDETTFAVTLYKIVHDLKGVVDLVLMTDGQGGYTNTELASQYYGINLTDSVIGRSHLPAIRKRELMNSGKIIGIRNFFFFDQPDDYYSQEPNEYIGGIKWDVPMVEKKLDAILARNNYNYVVVMLPTPDQHGHHKSSTLLALRAVKRINNKNRPVVLGALEVNQPDLPLITFKELPGFPESKVRKDVLPFTFDRLSRFGFLDLVSYMIVHDWTIAEYKSQGDTQNNYMSKFGMEAFWYFDINPPDGIFKVQKLFDQLKASGYPTK